MIGAKRLQALSKKDEPSEAEREQLDKRDWTDEELGRLKSSEVMYMEIRPEAGAFSCSACKFSGAGDSSRARLGHCNNEDVDAPVSPKHGCCNLYYPKKGVPLFSANDE